MTVTLATQVAQLVPFAAGAAATMPTPWTYAISDTATVGDVVATSPAIATRTGQAPSMTLTGRVPVGAVGLDLAAVYEYLDLGLAVIASGTVDAWTAVSASSARTVTLPTAPEGSRWWRVKLVLTEGVSEIVYRTNLFTQPRPANALAPWGGRNSWAVNRVTGSNMGVADLTTWISLVLGSAETGTFRGLNLYQAIDAASPTAGNGIPVTPGGQLTFSAYVYSTKAVSFVPAVRFFSGTTWTAAATSGAGVLVSTPSWVRVSVTVTVPAGATHMAAAVWVPASTAWGSSDSMRFTGFLVEKASSALDWFAGSYNPGTPYSVRWTGGANASSSQLYTPGEARGRQLVVSNVVATAVGVAQELLSGTLTRPLRRSVYDALNVAAPQVSIGTPGLLAGSLLYLCEDLESALAFDAIYQLAGAATLNTGTDEALDGFRHVAVGELKLTAEKALPGKPARWTVQAEVREVEAS